MRFSDWSSDVCSSDLRRACGVVGASLGIDAELERQHHLEWRRAGAHHISEGVVQGDPGEAAPVARAPVRSAERRGGNEWVRTCRSRGSPYHYKTKSSSNTTKNTTPKASTLLNTTITR